MANKKDKPMWQKYNVTMEFENKVCGSVPQSKELIRPWLEARMPKKEPDDARPIEELEEEVAASIDETVKKTTLGFQHDDNGLFIRGGTIKAHLKDCANQIKEFVGITNFKFKVANKVYIDEYRVYLMRNGDHITHEDDSYEQPIHFMTPKGPDNALKNIRYVNQPTLNFTIKIFQDTEVNIASLTKVFDYGSIHGYGGERGLGEGRYKFEIAEN